LIAPDGGLARLSFAALPIGGEARLIDRYSVVQLLTGRDLLRPPAPPAAPTTSPLVVADPDYDADDRALDPVTDLQGQPLPSPPQRMRALGRFTRLPGTAAEGSVVAELLDVPVLTGADASKSRVLLSRSPRVLHIATHGFSLEKHGDDAARPMLWEFVEDLRHRGSLDNPLLRCGLAMAGANTYLTRRDRAVVVDDGILNGEDISSLDLRGTELVVLSACETGLGKIHAGEGVLGLVRAFLLAGAQAVVATLWPIPDLATHLLIEHFYRALAVTAAPAEALALAQLATRSVHADPVDWAGFVCYEAHHGDPPTPAHAE
jgi:CHAT domain-containing protein